MSEQCPSQCSNVFHSTTARPSEQRILSLRVKQSSHFVVVTPAFMASNFLLAGTCLMEGWKASNFSLLIFKVGFPVCFPSPNTFFQLQFKTNGPLPHQSLRFRCRNSNGLWPGISLAMWPQPANSVVQPTVCFLKLQTIRNRMNAPHPSCSTVHKM